MKLAGREVFQEQDPQHSAYAGSGLDEVHGARTKVRSFRARDIAAEPLASETSTLGEFRKRWRLVTDLDGTRWVPR